MIGASALLLALFGGAEAQARCPQPGETRVALLFPRETATPAMVTGASLHGYSVVGASLGYPQQALRAQTGLCDWTLSVEYMTTSGADHWPAFGVSRPWLEWRRLYIGGEALLGAHLQGGLAPERGPMLEGRLRVARVGMRLTPYASLSTRHVLSMTRVRVDTPEGFVDDYSLHHAWRPDGALGLGVGLGDNVGLDLALDLPWPSPPKVSIPGVHLGVQVGGYWSRG